MANISADGGLELRGYRAAVITTFRRDSRIIGATTTVFISLLFSSINLHSRSELPRFPPAHSRRSLECTRARMVADLIFPAYYRENPCTIRERNRIEIGFASLLASNYHLVVAARSMIERLKCIDVQMDGWMDGLDS